MSTSPTLDPVVADLTRREFIAGGTAMALLLAACGSDDSSGDGGEARQLEDALGPVDVPSRPERIVADSVSTLAHLWALGIVPVGAAIPEGISPEYIGDGVDQVANLVADDGWTLNVEAALAEQPDLIVAVGADYNVENCERYKAAMATYCFVDRWGTEQDIKEVFVDIAIATGREDEAADAIAAYDDRKRALAERVEATDLGSRSVAVVRIDAGGWIGIRVVDTGAAVLEALGMRGPDWGDVELMDGYVELSLETLEMLNAADTLIVTIDDDMVADQVETFTSPLWSRLDPVRAGQVHIFTGWNGGDLPQLNRMLDDIEQALVIPAEQGE